MVDVLVCMGGLAVDSGLEAVVGLGDEDVKEGECVVCFSLHGEVDAGVLLVEVV